MWVQAGVLTLTNDSDIQQYRLNLWAAGRGSGGRWSGMIGIPVFPIILLPMAVGYPCRAGVLELSGSHVMSNQAIGASGQGGGIQVINGGSISLAGSTNVAGNTAFDGAGIYADSFHRQPCGMVIVYANAATNNGGGGIYLTAAAP